MHEVLDEATPEDIANWMSLKKVEAQEQRQAQARAKARSAQGRR